MKIAGYILLIFGGLSFLGAAFKGNSVFGPLFCIALGAFLVAISKNFEESKIAGYIVLIIGGLSFFGAAFKGDSVFGPLLCIALGVFLVAISEGAASEKSKMAKQDGLPQANEIEDKRSVLSKSEAYLKHIAVDPDLIKQIAIPEFDSIDDSRIETIERYTSWREYQQRHPSRAKEIRSLGIDLSRKRDDDVAEWLFSIETTARDSNCKISELKQKYYDAVEKQNFHDADWIYLLKTIRDFTQREAEKYNLKIGNTAGDMLLIFVLDKIKEIESKYKDEPSLSKSDPMTLSMRFMLDSNDDILMLQKMHIYLRKYPLTEQSKKYRDNWHRQVMSLIKNRISQYDNLKGNSSIYNMAVKTEIFKFIHDEMIENVPQNVLDEFNDHLLSFHEEMEIIQNKAIEACKLSM